jgi:multisubunit Na+/H+ antiporter MnhB subunit
MRKILAAILTATIIGILLLGVDELPEFGNPENPTNNYVSERYIDKGIEETGAKNIVAGVILDYRAFDTFVEATVLFTSIIIIISILKPDSRKPKEDGEES